VQCTFSMTDNQQTPAYLQRGELRVGDLATLFSEMNDLVKLWKAKKAEALEDDENVDFPKAEATKVLTKISEMQTVHLMLLRAEEAFYEKIVFGTNVTAVDYDVVRTQIGSALDRIRAATDAEEVCDAVDG